MRIWVVSLVLLAIWLGLLLDPMVGPLILGVLMAFGLTLALIVGTMGLGIMGFGLFAAGDHVIAWLPGQPVARALTTEPDSGARLNGG